MDGFGLDGMGWVWFGWKGLFGWKWLVWMEGVGLDESVWFGRKDWVWMADG